MKAILEVEVVFYDYSNGGRKKPIKNGYRTSILFGLTELESKLKGKLPIDKHDFSLNSSGEFNDFNTEKLNFNEFHKGNLVFNNFNHQIKVFFKQGEKFIIFEGLRIVGRGTILSSPDGARMG